MTTRNDLSSAPLPHYDTGRYCVVTHLEALEIIEKALRPTKYKVVKEELKLSGNRQISDIELTVNYSIDHECECVIRFLNSYNKQRAFRLDTALRVIESGNIFMLSGTAYRRLHTGNANQSIEEAIYTKLMNIEKEYKLLALQKETLKKLVLNRNQAYILLATLFLEKDIISSEQFNYVKKEMLKSTFNYGCDPMSAFHFFMLCTLAIEKRGTQVDHKYQQHEKLHEFFITLFKLEYIQENLWMDVDVNKQE